MKVAIMSCVPIPVDEGQRLAALHRYCVMDTPPEPAFDRLTHLAQHMLHAPTALVSLVDSKRQWFKSRIGMEASETPREVVILQSRGPGQGRSGCSRRATRRAFCRQPPRDRRARVPLLRRGAADHR